MEVADEKRKKKVEEIMNEYEEVSVDLYFVRVKSHQFAACHHKMHPRGYESPGDESSSNSSRKMRGPPNVTIATVVSQPAS
ncbi:unnamed protein product [Sphenostylis stenocarpa]|uniref:Uncharacterized protein n=1 Tax=Sphenostylis stenocarpa TaxID=92480 RepID=A0AA86SSU0_9FABA|nr:unnamed protein product [Sphenostylis stenocarpa]